jgi:glycosyltransferase involved in cell wall biosynthesis
MSGSNLRLAHPIPLRDQQWDHDVEPVVSVLIPTFNQEQFIADALEGVLMQRTTFRVEIIVHDDASTDQTLSIIKQYAEPNPNLFRVIAQSENQHSRGGRALLIINALARGKYVAICEGDDFWIAPDKLECQVRTLDERPDASGSIHRADGLFQETGETIKGLFGPTELKPEYGIDDLLVGDNFVPTASIVLRRTKDGTMPSWIGEIPHGDICILSKAALAGPLLYLDRSMSVYRKHAGGIHSREGTAQQALNCIMTLGALGRHLDVMSSESYRTGLSYRIHQLRAEISRYENRIADLEAEVASQREGIAQILGSRTFRIGMFFQRIVGRNPSKVK